MQAFVRHTGIVVPIDRPNVDTDAIIPKQFLKSIRRSGFGGNLFDEWRYLDVGLPDTDCAGRPLNPECVLNEPRYRGASIMLVRENFGCGSSREHAAWALGDSGFRALVGTTFADIFFSNCCKNGIVPVSLPAATVDSLFEAVAREPGYPLTIDLEAQTVTTAGGTVFAFEFSPGLRQRLLHGLDDIGVSLQQADAIRRYESRRRDEAPWLFPDLAGT